MNHSPVVLSLPAYIRATPRPSSTFPDVFLMHDFFPAGLSNLGRILFEMRVLDSVRTVLYSHVSTDPYAETKGKGLLTFRRSVLRTETENFSQLTV